MKMMACFWVLMMAGSFSQSLARISGGRYSVLPLVSSLMLALTMAGLPAPLIKRGFCSYFTSLLKAMAPAVDVGDVAWRKSIPARITAPRAL